MKRKFIWAVAAALAIAVLASCAIVVRGNVYLKYGWDTDVTNVYDTNPAFLNNMIVESQYYETAPGNYDISYSTLNNGSYYSKYTITADYAYLGDPYGPYDSYFELYLSDVGPLLSSPSYSRSLGGANGSSRVMEKAAGASPIIPSQETLGAPAGVLEKKLNGYTLHLEYWKLN